MANPTHPEIAAIVSEYSYVFQEPSDLTPKRAIDYLSTVPWVGCAIVLW